ncbi:MAG: class I SAM-dependent methyltransferase [Myxococcota bacterium]
MFGDLSSELARLEAQAQACFRLERPVYQSLGLLRECDVLDVGCGSGGPASLLMKEGCRVTGVDRDASYTTEVPPGMRRFTADAANLPFKTASFDFAYSRLAFQHLPNPVAAAEEMTRVTRPDGRVVIVDADHSCRSVFPPLHSVTKATSRWIERAQKIGANAEIGPALPGILATVGLRDIRVDVVQVDTTHLSKRTFADILLAPMLSTIANKDSGTLEQWVANPAAYAFAPLFIVSGRVPYP